MQQLTKVSIHIYRNKSKHLGFYIWLLCNFKIKIHQRFKVWKICISKKKTIISGALRSWSFLEASVSVTSDEYLHVPLGLHLFQGTCAAIKISDHD